MVSPDRPPTGRPARSGPPDDRMTDLEAVMWYVDEDPFLSSTFGSITLLDRAPDRERLWRRLDRMARATPRLHQRVLTTPARLTAPVWEADPDFDLDQHVRRVALPAPGRRADLFDLASRFVQDP